MAKRITFPKVSGTSTWRNAETGIVIRKSEQDNGDGTYYTVEVAGRDTAEVIMVWSAPKLAEAREWAVGAVVVLRAMIASRYSDAITENAERAADVEARAICASMQWRAWLDRHGLRAAPRATRAAALERDHAEALAEDAAIRNFTLSMIGANGIVGFSDLRDAPPS